MSNEDKRFWTALVLVIPFLVSGAWWVSPWLGVPALVVGGVLWVGALMMHASKGKQ